jgi:hypothetical protein
MDGIRNRNRGTGSLQRLLQLTRDPSMSEMLAEAIGESVPDGLRDALRALDQGKGTAHLWLTSSSAARQPATTKRRRWCSRFGIAKVS